MRNPKTNAIKMFKTKVTQTVLINVTTIILKFSSKKKLRVISLLFYNIAKKKHFFTQKTL